MSLESKLSNLTIGDEPTVVEAIKAEGVEKSGFASNISALAAKCVSKEEDEALAALQTVKAVAEGASQACPFIKECLSGCKFKIKSSHFVVFKKTLNIRTMLKNVSCTFPPKRHSTGRFQECKS